MFVDEKNSNIKSVVAEDENKYLGLFEKLGSAVVIYTAVNGGEDFVLNDFNQAAGEMHGWTKNEIIGRCVSEVSPEIKDSGLLAVFKNVLLTGNSKKFPISFYKDERLTSWKENYIFKLSCNEIVSVSEDLTNQKQVEQKLKEQELFSERSLLRAVVDNIPDLIYVKDREARKTLANKADISVMRLKSEIEAIGKDDFAFYPYERAKEFVAEDKKVIDTGEPALNIEGYHLDESGKWHWYITSKYPYRDVYGNIIGLVGIGRDITEHKLRELDTERRLKNAYAQQATIVTISTNEAVIHGDIRAAAKLITETVCRLMNIERVSVWLFNEERTEINCIDLYELSKQIHSEGLIIPAASYPNYFRALDDGQSIDAVDAETDIRTSEFAETYLKPLNIISMLDSPIRVDGQVVGIVCHENVNKKRIWEPDEILFASKIADQIALVFTTDQKQKAEFELKLHLERQKSLVKLLQSHAGSVQEFLDLTLEEAIKITDSQIGYLFNYDENKKEFILNNFSNKVLNAYWLNDSPKILELEKTGMLGETVRQRKEIVVNDFTVLNQNVDVFPQGHVDLTKYLCIPFFQGDQIVFVIGVANKNEDYNKADITNINFLLNSIWGKLKAIQSEEALRKSEANLRELNISKDKFFSIIAHDLRSPFQGFIALTEAMALDVEHFSRDELADFSMEINRSAHNLLKLLQNLLDWSQIQNGMIEFVPKKYSLKELVTHNIDIHKYKSSNKKIEIINEVRDSYFVNADESMINSVFRNILSNALKFTPRKGSICINAKEREKFIEVSIKDSGIGIPSTLIKNLFKIEEKVGRRGIEGEESSSLGLILCKEFVEKHGGNIWAESEENKGSTFFITLPCAE